MYLKGRQVDQCSKNGYRNVSPYEVKGKNKKNKDNYGKGQKGRDVGHGGVKHVPSKSTIDMSSHGQGKVRNGQENGYQQVKPFTFTHILEQSRKQEVLQGSYSRQSLKGVSKYFCKEKGHK